MPRRKSARELLLEAAETRRQEEELVDRGNRLLDRAKDVARSVEQEVQRLVQPSVSDSKRPGRRR